MRKASHMAHMAPAPQEPQSAFQYRAAFASGAGSVGNAGIATSASYRALKAMGIVCGVILALLLAAYIAGSVFFMSHLWPNTSINGTNLSLMTEDEALDTLSEMSAALSVHVSGQGVDFTLTSASAGLELNTRSAVETMFDDIVSWQWPVQVMMTHDESDVIATSYDHDLVRSSVSDAISDFNATATDPVNASVSYDAATGAFVVNEGSVGTKLDADAVADAVLNTLASEGDTVVLTSAQLVQQTVTASDPGLVTAAQTANFYLTCNANLTINGTIVATVNADLVRDWISVGGDNSVIISDSALVAWVDALEKSVDSVGGTISYTRADGKVVSVTGGSYGWITDGAGIEELVYSIITNGTTGDQEIPCKQTADVYNPGGKSWTGLYVDVDITEQHAYCYDASGNVIWETDIISGATFDDRETPTGVYYITNRALNQTLIGLTDPNTGLPKYETPVTYWMPFVGNMVGLHDASWQSAFGGTLYTTEAGSHGCINLPPAKAAELWDIVSIGTVVVTHY